MMSRFVLVLVSWWVCYTYRQPLGAFSNTNVLDFEGLTKMANGLDWDACTSRCLTYTVAYPGYYEELHCVASDFYCMCREEPWAERLINGDPTPLGCIRTSCAEPAKIVFAASISSECSEHGIDIDTMVNTRNPLFTYFNARPAGSSTVPVMVTSNTMPSTSAFIPVTSSMAMATRSASGSGSSTAADVGGGRKDKEDGLSASATGGLAAGVTVAGIAILALLWFLIYRPRMKRAQAVASVQPQFGEANGDTKDKVAYQHHNIYPATHELQGDDPSASTSELDSIRPVSELGSPGPVSEGFLHRNARERWSGNTALVKSPKLTDLSEGEEGEGQDETGAGGGLGGKRGSRAHRRFSSV